MPNGISRPCRQYQSISVLRVVGWYFSVFFFLNFNRTFCKQTVETLIRRRGLHINTFEQYHDTGMQNDEWALPRKYLWQSRCHRVAHKCLDNVKMYKNPLSYGTYMYFRTAILKHSVRLPKTSNNKRLC